MEMDPNQELMLLYEQETIRELDGILSDTQSTQTNGKSNESPNTDISIKMNFDTLTSRQGPGPKKRKRFNHSSDQSEEDENNYKRILDSQAHLIRICETNFANIFLQLQQFQSHIMDKVDTVCASARATGDCTIFNVFPLKTEDELILLEMKMKDPEYCAKLTDIVQQLAGPKNFRRYFMDNVVSLLKTSSKLYKILENVWEDSNFAKTLYEYSSKARHRIAVNYRYNVKKTATKLPEKQMPSFQKTPIKPVREVNQQQVQQPPRFQLSMEQRPVSTQLAQSQQTSVQPTNAQHPAIEQWAVPQPLTKLPIEERPVQTLPDHRLPFLRSKVQRRVPNHLSQSHQPSIQQIAKQPTTPVIKVFQQPIQQPQVQRSTRFQSIVNIQQQPPQFIVQPSLSISKTNSPSSVPCLPNPQCSISILPIPLPPGSSPSIPKDPLS